MATELPMRIVETSGAREWPSSKDSAVFGPPLKNMAAEELGLLLRDHRLLGNQAGTVPNRSGSAPPSMEGSFEALGNLLAQKNVSLDPNLASLTSAIENCESEEQLRADPAYIAYYCSHVNLNPRLPPPLISQENRRLVRHIGGFGNNWRLTSFDDSGDGSLHLSGGSLFTHKEEPEDEKATFQDLHDATGSSIYVPGSNMASLAGRHKSLVDLIQEDFPRTPSPVYQSRSSSHVTKEAFDCDVHVISSNISSMNIVKGSESGCVSADGVETCALDPSTIGLISNNEPIQASSTDAVREPATPQKEDFGRKESKFGNKTSIASLGLSQMSENNVKVPEGQQPSGRNMPLHHGNAQQNTSLQNPIVQDQVLHQGTNQSQGRMERLSHGHIKSSSGDEQGRLLSAGQSPSVYPTAATYMTSNTFYPNLQPQGVYPPQYGLGGYALSSTLLPPYMPAYAPHGAFHVPFSAASSTSFSGRTGGVSGSQGISNIGDMQHGNKIYGQHGLAYQPPFMDPLHMQYFHHPFEDAYGASTHVGRFPRGGVAGPVNTYMPHNEATMPTHMGDPKLQFPGYGNLNIPNTKKGEMLNSNYFGSPPNLGVMTHFPGSPLASPVVPSSPVGGLGPVGRRNEVRFSPASTGNGGMYSGWQGQRGVNSFDDLKRNSFLEELKSNNSRKFELSDIVGRVVEFSVDQHGSRFIQQKLETSSFEEKEAVFKEVLPHASKLMTDVFGNYVIQKFFEHGSPEQRKELANQLAGQMVPLSLQMYGCRVIQKALEVIELDQKTRLVHELDEHVMKCVRDQNGNHVIQKCIESVPTERIAFIISAFRSQVATLSTHPYGCRVIQRVLEHCSDELQSQCIVDEILESAYKLAQDQYGNYVTQHVLERGKSEERSQIISKLTGKIVQMSQHKYASNVVEKCLEHGDATERALMIEEIIGQSEENDNLLAMMKDQFANYVVQKILEVCNDKHREILLNRINTHLHALKKYTYGKHIVARFEQLFGEESQSAESTTR